jgi:AcrR family transcriptional regulator
MKTIVDAAAAESDEHGFEALSLGAVAGRLGVKPPSLYNHVDGLDGLRRALSVHALEVLADVSGRAAIGKSREEALLSMGMAVREFARSHPGLYAATVRAHSPHDTEALAAVRAAIAPFEAVLSGFGFHGPTAIHALRALRSAVHGFAALETAGGFGLPADLEVSFRFLLSMLTGALGHGSKAARKKLRGRHPNRRSDVGATPGRDP